MGTKKCDPCFGRGKIKCNHCAGGGRALGGINGMCPICHGATKINCYSCNGRGSVYSRDPKPTKKAKTAAPELLISEARNTPTLSKKADLYSESDWLLGGLGRWLSTDGKFFAYIVSIFAGLAAVWAASTMTEVDTIVGVAAFAGGLLAPAMPFYLLQVIVGLLTMLTKMLFSVLIVVGILGAVIYGLDRFF